MMDTQFEPEDAALDPTKGFIAAACAPAVLASLIGLIAFPFIPVIFLIAFMIAALHVGLLAAPLYALIRLWREPGPAVVLPASVLIGALPIPLLSGWSISPDIWPLAICGLSGGLAFLHFSRNAPPPSY